jgi:hypothetical protein
MKHTAFGRIQRVLIRKQPHHQRICKQLPLSDWLLSSMLTSEKAFVEADQDWNQVAADLSHPVKAEPRGCLELRQLVQLHA